MCSSESRAQVMKPLLIKAGIPAAFSIAAYVVSRIMSRQSSSSMESSLLGSDDTNCQETTTESFLDDEGSVSTKLEELGSQVEELQQREWELESRYFRYRALKEKEFILMEIKNKMVLEKLRAECMLQEISLAEEENKKVGSLLIEYIKLVYKVEDLKNQNGFLERKVRKLSKRVKEQKLLIEARDEEMLKVQKEFEIKECIIGGLENEVKQFKEVIDHLQREKIDLTHKLDLAQTSYIYNNNRKVEIADSVSREEYERVEKEVLKLESDKEGAENELAYLRRSNAFLRHELVRCHEQQDEHNIDENINQHLVDLFESEDRDHDEHEHEHEHEHENCTIDIINPQVPSKRRRFIQKFKKWVDESLMEEKEKREDKCFGKQIVSEEAGDLFVHARKSRSSV